MESDRIMQLRNELLALEDEIEASPIIDFILMGRLNEVREEIRNATVAATGTV